MNKKLTKDDIKQYPSRYMPGLDGLRAIAVIAIIIYHLNKQWLSGGFLGVDTFFVISGYLITSLLLKEYEETGIIRLKRFWIRRIKRLLPALMIVLMTVGTLTLWLKPSEIIRVKHDIYAALLYVSNWWYIARDVDYFEQFSFVPLKHLWSLAIEEQFYLFFPFILIMLLLLIRKKYLVGIICFVISLLSLGLMLYYNDLHISQSRIYFGTDTRLQTLLLGVVLAFLWPPFKLKQQPPTIVKHTIDIFGFIGFSFLVLLFFMIHDDSHRLYNGGFYIVSCMTLLVIASAVHPTTLFAKILSNPLLVYIGKRSYSLYLWHYPVISFVHSYFIDGQMPIYVYIIDVIATFILAEVSYRCIETPFRVNGLKAMSWRSTNLIPFIRTLVIILLLIPFIFLICGAFDKYGKDDISTKAHSFNTDLEDQYLVELLPLDKIRIDGLEDKSDKKSSTDKYRNLAPLLIGDSVMVDIGESFKSDVPKAKIDGKVGRQLYQTLPLVKSNYGNYKKANQQVVLELGTNGDFTVQQLDQLLSQFGKAQVYLVNTRVPRFYEAHVNKLLANAAKKHKNVTLIDWYKRSRGHSEYFAPDGVHLEQKGVEALKDEILSALKKKK